MTGPEHYAQAEQLIADAEHAGRHGDTDVSQLLRFAQVHATLAVAAATAGNSTELRGLAQDNYMDWMKAGIVSDYKPAGAP